MEMRIVVPGVPMGKPRMTRRDKWMQRKSVLRYWSWADTLRAAVRESGRRLPPADTVRSLDWVAYFEPPRSWSKKKRLAAIGQLHRSKPDRDNLDKGVLDSLYQQDSGIASGTIEKRWGEPPRMEIVIQYEPHGGYYVAA